jgi:hypothetical protein
MLLYIVLLCSKILFGCYLFLHAMPKAIGTNPKPAPRTGLVLEPSNPRNPCRRGLLAGDNSAVAGLNSSRLQAAARSL